MASSWVESNIIILATVAAFAVLIILSISLFRPAFDDPQVVFVEEPLEKNKELQLFPGEAYRYSYAFNNTSINITYLVLEGPGCTRIRLLEKLNDSEICIDRAGNDPDRYNSTFRNPSFLLFKPWMLALKDGWRWNSTMYFSFDDSLQRISGTGYRVIRSEPYGNRTAFLVEIKSDEGPAEYQWVDAEKRVLLKTMGEGYEVVLAEPLAE